MWGDFYNSNYLGVFRIDQWLGIGLGVTVLAIVLIAVGGTLAMRWVQNRFWPSSETDHARPAVIKLQGSLIAVAVLIAIIFSFFPTEAYSRWVEGRAA